MLRYHLGPTWLANTKNLGIQSFGRTMGSRHSYTLLMVPQIKLFSKKYVQILNITPQPYACKCDLIWKQGLCRCT